MIGFSTVGLQYFTLVNKGPDRAPSPRVSPVGSCGIDRYVAIYKLQIVN